MDKQNMMRRRAMIAGLGAVAAAGALGARSAEAQGPSSDAFTPMLHAQDEWMSAMNGKHRIVLDVTSPAGVPCMHRSAGSRWCRPDERDATMDVHPNKSVQTLSRTRHKRAAPPASPADRALCRDHEAGRGVFEPEVTQ